VPYIDAKEREVYNELVSHMRTVHIGSPGQLNYLLTQLVHAFLGSKKQCYQHYNDVLGALEGCKLELYRHDIAGYENSKIDSNGDVP